MPAGCTDKKYICKYQTDDTLGDRCVPSLRAAKITLTCGGGGQILPPPPQRYRELPTGRISTQKKRHSTRRDVNFLNMPGNLDFDQKGGVRGTKKREKSGIFKWSLYPCFSTDFDGKRCFRLLKYRSLTYQVRGSGKRKIRGVLSLRKMGISLQIFFLENFLILFPNIFSFS